MIGVWNSVKPAAHIRSRRTAHHRRAQHHLAVQPLAPQVEEAVAQARLLRVVLLAEDRKGQLLRGAQHLDAADEDLDLAGRDLGVHQVGRTRLHLAVDADAPLRPHLLDLGEDRAVGVGEDLGDAVMVAQVDEEDARRGRAPDGPSRRGARSDPRPPLSRAAQVCVRKACMMPGPLCCAPKAAPIHGSAWQSQAGAKGPRLYSAFDRPRIDDRQTDPAGAAGRVGSDVDMASRSAC